MRICHSRVANATPPQSKGRESAAANSLGPPSSFSPRVTIASEAPRKGRYNFKASSTGNVSQVSISVSFLKMTGVAFGWIAPTSALASVVKKLKAKKPKSQKAMLAFDRVGFGAAFAVPVRPNPVEDGELRE